MARLIELTDLEQPGAEVYSRLTEAQLRARREAEKGLFIAESARVIEYALDAGYEPVSFLMERRQLAPQGKPLLERCGDAPVYVGERELLTALTGYALTRGVLCALRRPPLPAVETVCAGARRIAVLENITDAANVGALFRSAAALGMDALLLTPACCDALCRRAMRVSMGAVFRLPWTRLDAWPEAGLSQLRALGFQVAALALREDALPIDDPRLSGAARLALLLGTEGTGLDARTVSLCDWTARIPMARGMDSLNVAAAGAVAFWALAAR